MTPQKQKFLHKPSEGSYGDCFRTTIAILLDLDRDDIPHFGCLTGPDDGGFAEQLRQTREWLSAKGLTFLCWPIPGDADWREVGDWGWFPRDQHFVLMGQSKVAVAHCVVASADGGVVCDPSLEDSGIIGPCKPEGVYWLGVIAKMT